MNGMARFARALACVALPAVLAGCGDGGIAELQQWMSQTRSQVRPVVPKLAEPKKFTPFSYAGKNGMDPTSPAKIAEALAQQGGAGHFKPDLERRREALESYPLDTLKMVGTLRKASDNYALVQADHAIFRAKVGNYLGQNLGRITAITDSEIELKETVQDASGEWVERNAKLELQESKK
jgi:type IV pilus assembly protein PilP